MPVSTLSCTGSGRPAALPAAATGSGHFGAGEAGGEAEGREKSVLRRQNRAEEEDGPVRLDPPQDGGLGHVGDGEEIRPRPLQRCRRLGQAVAVGVGLDHRDVAHGPRQRGPDQRQVAFQGGQIDVSAQQRGGGSGGVTTEARVGPRGGSAGTRWHSWAARAGRRPVPPPAGTDRRPPAARSRRSNSSTR